MSESPCPNEPNETQTEPTVEEKPTVKCYIPAGVVLKQLNLLTRELSHTSLYSPHRQYLERAIEDHKSIMAHKEFIVTSVEHPFRVSVTLKLSSK